MYYIICSCPRSGSTLLADGLAIMGAGKPDEFFNSLTVNNHQFFRRKDFMQPTLNDYIERIKQENTINNIFGIKIHYGQLAKCLSTADQILYFFPNAKYISITRRNILRQAISASRAGRTQAWTAQLPEQRPPHFNYFTILKYLIHISNDIEHWEKFYAVHNIKPLRILYEDLDEDYENTMRKVVAFLGISGDIPPPPLKKQADALTEDWIKRFVNAFQGKGIIDIMVRFFAGLCR